MNKFTIAVVASGLALLAVTPALAEGGCGRGWHRGPYAHCRPDGGPLITGTYYAHQGWWDGHRYWHHRDRWHGGWRYR